MSIATFPPHRPTPDQAALDAKVAKWLGGWSNEVGVGWDVQGRLTGAAWARATDRDIRDAISGERLAEVVIGVLPEWRGRGIGTRLVRGLQAAAVERGRCGLWLRVSGQNPAAIRLYETTGFAHTDRRTENGLLVMSWTAPR